MKKIVLIFCILIILIIACASYIIIKKERNKDVKIPDNSYLVVYATSPANPWYLPTPKLGYSSLNYYLYSDGTVIDIVKDLKSDREESKKSHKISNKKMVKLFEILDGDFKNYTEDIGIEEDKIAEENEWKIVYYDETGDIIHEYNGYIYGNNVLEELIKLITK